MSTTLPRQGLAAVEARAQPAFRAPIQRNRGTTWAYPGFGRDPELGGNVPVVAPLTPAAAAPAPAAEADADKDALGSVGPAAGGGESAGDSFSVSQDMAANPEAYQNTVLADIIQRGLAMAGLGGGDTSTTIKGGREAIEQTPAAVTDMLMFTADTSPTETFVDEQRGPQVMDSPAPAVTDALMAGTPGPIGAPTEAPAEGFPGEVAEGSVQGGVDGGNKADTSGTPGGYSNDGGNDGGKGGSDDGGSKGDTSSDPGGYGGNDFQAGGYTGAGPDGIVQPDQPAGTVHEGEVVIPAHQVAQHGVEPLMDLAGPGAQMGTPPAAPGGALGGVQAMPNMSGMDMGMGMMPPMGAGEGEPPMEDASVPSFQSTQPDDMGEGMEGDEGADYEMAGEDEMDDESFGPYRDAAGGQDPFKPANPNTGTTGGQAMQMLSGLSPDAQMAVLSVLGADPMASSALLQVLGPSFQPLIAAALKAGGAQAQQQQMGGMPGMMPPGGAPGAGPPPGGMMG